MTTAVFDQTIAKWTAQPESALSRPTVKAWIHNRQAVLQSGPFTWNSDLPDALGGANQAPGPTAMLLGALAGCAVMLIKDTIARQLGVVIDGVQASVSCSADSRGLLGLEAGSPDLTDWSLDLSIESPSLDGACRVVEVWRERCPVYRFLTRSLDIPVTVRITDPYAGIR